MRFWFCGRGLLRFMGLLCFWRRLLLVCFPSRSWRWHVGEDTMLLLLLLVGAESVHEHHQVRLTQLEARRPRLVKRDSSFIGMIPNDIPDRILFHFAVHPNRAFIPAIIISCIFI